MVVRYDGTVVGEYTVYLLVEDTVLIELNIAKAIYEIHLAQCRPMNFCGVIAVSRPVIPRRDRL